jgi:DEAD/DEAH box helicase domain-containing protein
MSIEEIIQSWRQSRATSRCITDFRVFKKREGKYNPFPEFLHPSLKKAIEEAGIERLYSHQAEAIRAIHHGENVVIVTPTASGKTLCYNLPVLHSKLTVPVSKALYLFPRRPFLRIRWSSSRD